jgi:hypothetical protein
MVFLNLECAGIVIPNAHGKNNKPGNSSYPQISHVNEDKSKGCDILSIHPPGVI